MAFARSLVRLPSLMIRPLVRESRTLHRLQNQMLSPSTSILWRRNNYRFIHEDKANKSVKGSQDESVKTEAATPSDTQQPLTQVQRLRKVFAEYGSIAVTFHVCISLTSLGICYTAVSSGLDVPGLLQNIGLSKGLSDSTLTTGASTFVIAYACHKVFVPLRMFLTITCTPLIVHKLRAVGFLKAPARP